jgi:histone deacetylase complex regulatory component SIN3
VQVQALFKDAQDLLSEFKDFLPEVSMALSGAVGMLPQSTSGPGVPTSWVDASDKNGKKAQIPPKKRRKAPEKETTPAPAVRTVPSRVRASLNPLHSLITVSLCRPRSPSTCIKGLTLTLRSSIHTDCRNRLLTIPRNCMLVCYRHPKCII